MLEMYEIQYLMSWAAIALIGVGWVLVKLWKLFLKALRNEGLWDDNDQGEGEED